MSKFQNYLKTFDITSTLNEEDIDKTLALLQIYGPAVRRTASRIGEMEEECYEGRRQSISDFINLASTMTVTLTGNASPIALPRWATPCSFCPLWRMPWCL